MEHAALRPGELVGDAYRVERHVGGGAMGQVFAATDLRTGALVALKMLSVELADQRDLERFQREAELAARVDRHGGVVRVHGAGLWGGRPYCVMEFVDGEDLESALRRGLLQPEHACSLIARVARTLAACHTEGVVHRDLKPANILLAADGTPKVADFGLARDMSSAGLTRTGELVGTPSYMAPEQAMDASRAVSPSVDIYSLGAVLYHALTGQPPFSGPSVLKVLADVTAARPAPPRSLRSDLTADQEAVCLRAIEKDPADRYESMDALADDLERAARGAQVEARPLGPLTRFSRRLERREPKAVMAAFAATALIVLAVLGPLWVVTRQARRDKAPGVLAAAEAFERETTQPWGLGVGGGAPPAAQDLEQHALSLERAAPYLPRKAGARARDLAASLRAQARLLSGRLDAAATDVPAAVVDAVILARRGELEAGLARLAAPLRSREPLARLGWAAVWEAALEADPGAAEECLRAAPRSAEPELPDEAVTRTVERAAAICLGTAIREGLGSRLGRLDDDAEALSAQLRRLFADGAPEVWTRVRSAAITETTPTWIASLEASAPRPGDAPRDPGALAQTVRALGSLLRSTPPMKPPPALDDALGQLFAASVEDLPAEGSASRSGGWWLTDLESLAFYELRWRCPRSERYLSFLRGEMRISGRPFPRIDLGAAVVRHGVFHRDHRIFTEGTVEMFVARAKPPQVTPADSAALRWLDFEPKLYAASSQASQPPHRGRLLELVAGILDAPLDDLGPPYRTRALHMFCKLLRSELEDAGAGADPQRVAALDARARELLGQPFDADHVTEAMQSLAAVAERRGQKLNRVQLANASLIQLRRAAQSAASPGSVARVAHLRLLEGCYALSKLADDREPLRAEEFLAEATEIGARIDAPTKLRQTVAFARAKVLRALDRSEAAEAVIRPWLDDALAARADFVKEAVKVAIAVGDLDEALRRLEIGERAHGEDRETLQEARRDYRQALRQRARGRGE